MQPRRSDTCGERQGRGVASPRPARGRHGQLRAEQLLTQEKFDRLFFCGRASTEAERIDREVRKRILRAVGDLEVLERVANRTGEELRYRSCEGVSGHLASVGAAVTWMHKVRGRYGSYAIQLGWRQVPAYRIGRAIDWVVDELADFRRWREENKTWRRLAHPYHRVTTWIDDRRPVPDTIDGMNRRGVVDKRKLGL